jgi:hypothetical protein
MPWCFAAAADCGPVVIREYLKWSAIFCHFILFKNSVLYIGNIIGGSFTLLLLQFD